MCRREAWSAAEAADATFDPGPVAQRSEQGTFNPRVLGSNPSGLTARVSARLGVPGEGTTEADEKPTGQRERTGAGGMPRAAPHEPLSPRLGCLLLALELQEAQRLVPVE